MEDAVNGDTLVANGDGTAGWTAAGSLGTKGYITGLTLSNNTTDSDHDIDVAEGVCRDAADTASLVNSATLVKQIDANWAAGSNAGGFPSGLTLTADTWYHVFLISNSGGTTVDAGFDTDLTASNLLADASGYNKYRRIGSVLTDSSSNIVGFFQQGNIFYWDSPLVDVDNSSSSTTAASETLSTPSGVKCLARVVMQNIYSSATVATLVSSLDAPDVTPDGDNAQGIVETNSRRSSSVFDVLTDTNSQVRVRSSATGATINLTTHGWIDPFSDFIVSGNSKGAAELFASETKQATTSGTAVDFTGIPSGVKHIVITFHDVSTDGAGAKLVQIGTGGTPTTSGYDASSCFVASSSQGAASYTTGFGIDDNAASNQIIGALTLSLLSGADNTWVAHGVFHEDGSAQNYISTGIVTLAGELDMIRITSVGPDTFDNGEVGVYYDNPDERTVVTNTTTINNTYTGALPAGMVMPFAGWTAPDGWLECDGTAVSRTTYSDLFDEIGTRYGIGDGSTTFNLPDYRGEFLRGYDNGAGNDPDAANRTDSGGGTTGDNVGTKQLDALQDHRHDSQGFSSGLGGGGSAIQFTSTAGIQDRGVRQVASLSGNPAAKTNDDETRVRNVSVMFCIKT